jgi:hypothetical protein
MLWVFPFCLPKILGFCNSKASRNFSAFTSSTFCLHILKFCAAKLVFKKSFCILNYLCCTGGTLWHLQNFLQYIILEFTLSIILLCFPSPCIPGIVSTGLIFPFTHMCIEYFQHIHPLTPFFISSSLLLVSLDRTCFASLFSDFIKKKKSHFCLFKGGSLWHFHVYMYYNPNWFISSSFLFSTLVPFLWWFCQV